MADKKKKKYSGGKQWNRVSGNPHEERYDLTNLKFAETNKEFIKMCGQAGVTATQRQASKYRNKKGSAYKFQHNQF